MKRSVLDISTLDVKGAPGGSAQSLPKACSHSQELTPLLTPLLYFMTPLPLYGPDCQTDGLGGAHGLPSCGTGSEADTPRCHCASLAEHPRFRQQFGRSRA